MQGNQSVKRYLWPIILALLPLFARAQASEVPPGTGQGLRLNGFGTVGLARAETDFDGTFRRDISQRTGQTGVRGNWDSRLGFQANYAINDRVELVGQAVLKDRPYANGLKESIEWAFASYRLTPDTTVRVGRTGMDLFLISDYRNVGFAYTAARPNADFYAMLPLNGLDGADVSHQWRLGEDLWRAKLFAGHSTYSITSTYKGELSSVFGLTLSRESDGLLTRGTIARTKIDFTSSDLAALRAGLTQVANTVPVPSVAAEARHMLDQGKYRDIRVTYASAAFAYDRSNWLLSGEYMRSFSDAPAMGVRAGYLTLGRRVGQFTLHTSVSTVRSDLIASGVPQWSQSLAPLTPLLGATAIQQIQGLGEAGAAWINSGRIEQRTISVGVRWDFDPRMALKLQWDRVKVAPVGGLIWTGKEAGGRAQVGTVVLDFLF